MIESPIVQSTVRSSVSILVVRHTHRPPVLNTVENVSPSPNVYIVVSTCISLRILLRQLTLHKTIGVSLCALWPFRNTDIS